LTEIEQRRRSLAARLPDHKVDALLVSSPSNVRYLSGFAGSNSLMLITRSSSHFFTDPRYRLEATQNITCKVHVATKPLAIAVSEIIKRKKLKKIGFESSWLHYDDYAKFKELLPIGSSLQPLGKLVEEQRMVKSPGEIELIRKSVLANSEAYRRTIRNVRPGLTEQDVAAELEFQMRRLGAEKPAFDTIVAAGPHSALPHAHPTAHRLGDNELLLIDMGASLDGYSSDMTRVAHLGSPPKRVRDMYRAVLEAQLAALNTVRAGVTASKVDNAARNTLKNHKLDREFVHSTGHGLGLEIHEPPRIAKREKTRLQAGMVITVEPGAYVEGFGGIRIEDTVLVTDQGCEILTPTPKEFITL
jgi:Xaa-Pro aminopeptidase